MLVDELERLIALHNNSETTEQQLAWIKSWALTAWDHRAEIVSALRAKETAIEAGEHAKEDV